MSKIKLTGSNSGYVELDSAADAGNLTLQLPTAGTTLLSNADNVFSGITTFTGLNITDDVTFNGASYNVVWDKSDNQLEFGDNAKLSFGASSDMQLYHDGNHSYIDDAGTGNLRLRSGTLEIQNLAGNKTSAIFSSGGGQTLNFNNSTKFVTTNTGVVITGICTATSFKGDGSALTGITQTTINNNADNRIITGSGTANTLNGENNLTFDGHDLDITRSNSSMRLTVSSDVPKINFNANSVSDAARITIEGSGGGGLMTLSTKTSGGSLTERLRITSGGKVNIGGDYTQTSYQLSVTDTGGNLFRIKTSNEGDYDLRFMIQNSESNMWHYGTDDFVFGNRYDRKLHFITNGQKRVTINGNLVGINQTAPQTGLHINQDWVNSYGSISVEGSANALVGLGLRSNGNYRGSLIWRDGSSGNYLDISTYGGTYPILFRPNATEALRIDDSGVKVPNGVVFSINKSSVTGNFHQEINYKAGQKGCIYLENHAYYSAQPPLRINNTDTNNYRAMEDVQFERAGALKGYIRISATSVTYSTSGSDERLKKNFETWNEEVLPDFKTLSPKLFNWIDDDDGTDKIKGFVAQDNLDKFPEAYNLTQSTDRYYFNPSGMVHYLMKAMQEAAIKIETLEAEVAALKSS